MSYSEKLKHPKWQKRRLEVLERAGFKCQCCGDAEETLHVHHLIYSKGEPWDAPLENLECLCETCHDRREEFNGFFGRSLVSTKLALGFYFFFKPIFDGRFLPDKNSKNILDLYNSCVSGRQYNEARARSDVMKFYGRSDVVVNLSVVADRDTPVDDP